MVVIRQVLNGNNDQTSSNQIQASYTEMKHWEELIDFVEIDCGPKEPYFQTVNHKRSLTL